MSLESRVEKLEAQYKNQDADLHSLAKVTAEIKNIALTNQHDIAGLKTNLAALAEATYAGFKRVDDQFKHVDDQFKSVDSQLKHMDERHDELVKEVRENQQENRDRFDQLELLIRQCISVN